MNEPKPIQSEEDLDRAIEEIDTLLDRDDLSKEEEEYLDKLGTLVHEYETREHPIE